MNEDIFTAMAEAKVNAKRRWKVTVTLWMWSHPDGKARAKLDRNKSHTILAPENTNLVNGELIGKFVLEGNAVDILAELTGYYKVARANKQRVVIEEMQEVPNNE